MLYCTLDEAKLELDTTNTADDDQLRSYIRSVSRRIDLLMSPRQRSNRPYFGPYDESLQWLVRGGRVATWEYTFTLGAPLLALSTLVLGGTAVTNVQGFPQGFTPYYKLRLTDWTSWYDYCVSDGSPAYAVVTGTWGYHSDYANAWQAVDTLQANINASVTSLTVADVDGDDPFGISPRISAGQLLKIGTEYLEVTATNTTTNVVTVIRGVNGSTAAAHTAGDTVSRWLVEEPIRHVTMRQAALLYARKGQFQSEITALGIRQFPPDLMTEMARVLGEYQYV